MKNYLIIAGLALASIVLTNCVDSPKAYKVAKTDVPYLELDRTYRNQRNEAYRMATDSVRELFKDEVDLEFTFGSYRRLETGRLQIVLEASILYQGAHTIRNIEVIFDSPDFKETDFSNFGYPAGITLK